MDKVIAIDFDGCLCENKWPDIGTPNWSVIHQALDERERGAKLILWTCREGELLDDAILACTEWGLRFDAVNSSLPEWIAWTGTDPLKVAATEYWDDRAVRKEYKPMNEQNALVQPQEAENVKRHRELCDSLNRLYAVKNADYGDSFHESWLEEGYSMARVRLSDKLSRFKTLTRSNAAQVKGESIRDTLIDLANYAIMTVMEMDREEQK